MFLWTKPKTGRRFSLRVCMSDTIAEVKQKIHVRTERIEQRSGEAEGLPVQYMTLMHDGRRLTESNTTLQQYGISNGALVRLYWGDDGEVLVDATED